MQQTRFEFLCPNCKTALFKPETVRVSNSQYPEALGSVPKRCQDCNESFHKHQIAKPVRGTA